MWHRHAWQSSVANETWCEGAIRQYTLRDTNFAQDAALLWDGQIWVDSLFVALGFDVSVDSLNKRCLGGEFSSYAAKK